MSKYRISVSIDGENFFWIVADKGRFIRNPTKEDLIGARITSYNKTNICDRCREDNIVTDNSILYTGKAYREYDKYRNWTERWLCKNCWNKNERKTNPNCLDNVKKSLANYRTGNLDHNSDTAKGRKGEDTWCEWRKTENYNTKINSLCAPGFDTKDPKYGRVQIRSPSLYYAGYWKGWVVSGLGDWHDFDTIVVLCIDEERKNIMRLYIIPELALNGQRGITITTGCIKWEEFRANNDIRKELNNIWKLM